MITGKKVQKDLDIQEYTDPFQTPHDSVYPRCVLKPGLIISHRWSTNGLLVWGRPCSEDLRRGPSGGDTRDPPRLGSGCAPPHPRGVEKGGRAGPQFPFGVLPDEDPRFESQGRLAKERSGHCRLPSTRHP